MEWKNADTTDQENTYIIPASWLFVHYYEALNLLFRIENALRVFVYIVLKNEFNEKWSEVQIKSEDEGNEGTILSIAKKRMSQSKSFGYLGHSIVCPVMHLTSGELTRLITSEAYWNLFKNHFLGSKEIMKNILEEIGSIRNSLSHFRPIKNDDVDVIKHNSKHVLLGIEQFLSQALIQTNVTPTNTKEPWYKELKTLGTDHCVFSFQQSNDEQWIRLTMKYNCPTIATYISLKTYISYNVLSIKSSAILDSYKLLRNNIAFLSEDTPYTTMPDNLKPSFKKSIAMVFGRKIICEKYAGIKDDLEKLLLTISNETELIEQDNLARGKIVHSVSVSATGNKTDEDINWNIKDEALNTPVLESDPPEYWGDLNFYSWHDFIASTVKYPWMPEIISSFELPF